MFDDWHAGEQRGLEKRERVAAGLAKARRGARWRPGDLVEWDDRLSV